MPLRSKGRELVLIVLYWNEWQPVEDVDQVLAYLCEQQSQWLELDPDPEDDTAFVLKAYAMHLSGQGLTLDSPLVSFARERILRVLARSVELDELLSGHSRRWRLDRMALIDKNILRLGAYELCFCPDVPPKVAINEAIELAKLFGTEDSPGFVNGVLDGIKKSMEKEGARPDG